MSVYSVTKLINLISIINTLI